MQIIDVGEPSSQYPIIIHWNKLWVVLILLLVFTALAFPNNLNRSSQSWFLPNFVHPSFFLSTNSNNTRAF